MLRHQWVAHKTREMEGGRILLAKQEGKPNS